MALGTLCEPSEAQHKRRTDLDRADREVANKGRVIVITQLQGEQEVTYYSYIQLMDLVSLDIIMINSLFIII